MLSGLTVGTDYSEEKFHQRFDQMFAKESHVYKIIVIEDNKTGKIIGSGTVFMEKKFLRN